MHSLVPSFLATTHDNFPVYFIAAATLIFLAGIFFRFQREKMWNDTVRAALEKGQPIPQNFEPRLGRRWYRNCGYGRFRAWRDLRIGIIMIAVGIGISLQSTNGHTWLGWNTGGAVPALIGAACLLNALLTILFTKNDGDSNPPPQP